MELDADRYSKSAASSRSALTERNVEAIAHLEEVANRKRSRAETLADEVSSFEGSRLFV